MSIATLTVRRSAGLSTAAIAAAVVITHLAFRKTAWVHEWTWATYEFGFVTVLLAPVIAASGAWEGHRLARSAGEFASLPRLRRLVRTAWLGVMAWAVALYIAGLLAAWALVLANGTPGWPGARNLLAVVPPIAFLGAAAAAGVAIGRNVARPLSVPLAAVLWFAATLYFYSVGPAQFVTVGGATGSLVGLRPRVGVELLQLALFACLTLACLAASARRETSSARPHWLGWVPAAISAVLVVGAAAALNNSGPDLLERTAQATRCTLDGPQLCTALGYRNGVQAAHDALVRYLQALQAAGVTPVPTRFDQTALPGEVTTGPLTQTFLAGRRAEAEPLVVAAYVSKTCSQLLDTRMQLSVNSLHWYLLTVVDHQSIDDPSLPTALTHGDPAAQQQVVRDAAAYLVSCSRSLGSK